MSQSVIGQRAEVADLISRRRVCVSRLNQHFVSRSARGSQADAGSEAVAMAELQQAVTAMAAEIVGRKHQIRALERTIRCRLSGHAERATVVRE